MMEKAPGARRISASMTVEASYIMAMVLLSLAVLIRTAYFECGKTTKIMQLHWAVAVSYTHLTLPTIGG